MSKRYKYPIPYGWYQVAYSKDLAPGESRPLRYFGEDLVIFRGEEGAVQVLDAYCPHMGAHLGYGIHKSKGTGGGCVKGNTITCPFHGWVFDMDGKVAEIPYAKKIPPRAQDKEVLKKWPTVERNQVISVWYHPDGIDPLWEVERLPELDDENSGWTRIGENNCRKMVIPTVMQEIAENSVDFAHFIFVHQVKSTPQAETTYDGPMGHRMIKADMQTPRGIVEGGIESKNIGPGLGWVRFTGIAETLLLSHLTPVEDELIEVNYSFLQPLVDGKEPAAGGVQDAIIKDIWSQMEEDYVIWEHKIGRENPMLCDGDGPIAQFRRYYSQFYAGA
ncbi:Rieske 2Fe-2S domain-containing protein [Parahaliea maris]|uniref:cholesterol 7-desaturase n=1 Tax=Parahaliea maris TaxID=2716870 RepID=A0A5C9A5R8_9GAMM|nr:Rieske 2Fe-2S domain-containing protein [Parahaliea maris]TXS96158.1 Rieske 2Fe-2S domain-containing protein [Parahaliea maris]